MSYFVPLKNDTNENITNKMLKYFLKLDVTQFFFHFF